MVLSALLPSPCGFEHPAQLAELPPVDLWITRGMQAHLAGNSRKILAICLLDSWRNWLFAWSSLPICVGNMFECAGLNPSFPWASGSPPANSLLAAPTSPHGPENCCVYLCLPPTLSRFPVTQACCCPTSLSGCTAAPATQGVGLGLACFL